MGRGKRQMDLIEKEKARKITFQKRMKGLMKKVYELSTLCSVDVGVIIFASEFLDEPKTWPQDQSEVIYVETTVNTRQKVYDVKGYFSERMKRIEGEISKMQKEKIQLLYPTWDDSYNVLQVEQLRMFISILDAKLDACNQRMNMLHRDSKGKTIADENMSQHNSQVPFYPSHLTQTSLSSSFHFGQNCNQLVKKDTLGAAAMDIQQEDESMKNQSSSQCYYNGNMQTMQPLNNVSLQTLPSQLQFDTHLQTLSDPSQLQFDALLQTLSDPCLHISIL